MELERCKDEKEAQTRALERLKEGSHVRIFALPKEDVMNLEPWESRYDYFLGWE